jgi:hypothetical protein
MVRLFFHIMIIAIIALGIAWPAAASKPSYHIPHPVGWMHQLPVGETPGWGWDTTGWINLEVNHANIWNDEFDLTNDSTGKDLTYQADFEQTSVIADIGFALGQRFAMGIEAPFASRGGGALDDFIDQFHVLIGSERFLRPFNSMFADNFTVETEGRAQMKPTLTAVGNLKLKAKYWLWKWEGSMNGSCDCGFAVSGQVKFPLAEPRNGWTSGHHDYSLLFHLGTPLFKNSGIWATAAYTAMGRNEIFADWPKRRWAQMYELMMDLGGDSWGVILGARLESPIMNKNELTYDYPTTVPEEQVAYRVASGWNSLVYWRGSQTAGLRWRSFTGHQVNLLIIEDWAVGHQDSRKDNLYVNNAPDVAFALQLHFKY